MTDFSTTALILVGHGSQRSSGSSRSTIRHAEILRARGLFASVHAAFLKQEPGLEGLLDTLDAETVAVVPIMAAEGYLTETLIPEQMGLTGLVTERITPQGHQRIYRCEAIGTHPMFLDAAAVQIADVIRTHNLSADETCVLVAGHGNSSNTLNADQTRRVATRIRAEGVAGSVRCAFLEQSPFIRDWRRETDAKTIVFFPYLISGGVHGAQDMPALMGLDPDDPALAALGDDKPAAGPFVVDDGQRTVFYLRPAGADPAVEDIIAQRVEKALSQSL